jgi:prevent-host-death family protein
LTSLNPTIQGEKFLPKPADKRLQSSQKLAKLLRVNESNYVSSVDLRHNTAAVLSRVATGGERIVLTRNGKPVAALVPFEDFKQIEKSTKRR